MCAKIKPRIQDTYHYEPQMAEFSPVFKPMEGRFWDNYDELSGIPLHTFKGDFPLFVETLSQGGIYVYRFLNIHEQPEKNLFWVLASVQTLDICVLIRVYKEGEIEEAQIVREFPLKYDTQKEEFAKSDLLEVCENGLIALSFRVESPKSYGGAYFYLLSPKGSTLLEQIAPLNKTPKYTNSEYVPFFAKDVVFLLSPDQSYLFFWLHGACMLQTFCLKTQKIIASTHISNIFELYMPAHSGDLFVVDNFYHRDLLILDPCDLKPVKRTEQELKTVRFAALQTFYRPRDAWNRVDKNASFFPQEDFAAYCEWTFPPQNEHKTCEVIQHINYLPIWHSTDIRLQFCSFQDTNRALLAYFCPNSLQTDSTILVVINAYTKEKIGLRLPYMGNIDCFKFGKNGACLYIASDEQLCGIADGWFKLPLNFHKPLPSPRPTPTFSKEVWKLLRLIFSGNMENIQLAKEISAGLGVDLDDCIERLGFAQLGFYTCEHFQELRQDTLSISVHDAYDLSPLQHLDNLQKLVCENKLIRDLRPLAHLKNLKELRLSGNFIQSLDGLENLSDLEILDCSNNQISDIRALTKLKKLKVVNLANNIVMDLNPLSDKLALQKLNISSNPAYDRFLSPLATCLNLEILKIEHMWMFDLKPLYNLAKLKKLYHSQNLRWQNTVSDFDNHRKANSRLSKCDTPTTAPYE